jgi:hypothetical protein
MFFTNLRYVTAPVPEPSTYAMLFGGLVVLGACARRRSNAVGWRQPGL